MSRSVLRVATVEWEPWYVVNNKSGALQRTGVMAKVLKSISQTLDIKYETSPPPDGQWGVPLPNGSWTGMMGEIERKNVEIALGPLAITQERLSICNFSGIGVEDELIMLAGRLHNQAVSLFGLVMAFDMQVWIFLLFTWLALSLVCAVVDSIETRLLKEPRHSKSFNWYFWELLGLILFEAMYRIPSSYKVKLILGTYMAAITILMSAFSGHIRASLMVRTDGDAIRSFQDLVDRPNVLPVTTAGAFFVKELQRTRHHVYQKVWERMLRHPESLVNFSYVFSHDILKQVMAGRKVILFARFTTASMVARRCQDFPEGDFYMVKERVFPFLFSTTIRKTMEPSLGGKIDKSIRRLVEGGLINQWMKEQLDTGRTCNVEDAQTGGHEAKTLTLGDAYSTLFLYIVGVAFSVCCFLGELLTNIPVRKSLKNIKKLFNSPKPT